MLLSLPGNAKEAKRDAGYVSVFVTRILFNVITATNRKFIAKLKIIILK
ncbi:MAG: hypothetical protein H0U39_03290 [Segetibacter sp.]|nr:hypothetical protein [Segetibacter sp.]